MAEYHSSLHTTTTHGDDQTLECPYCHKDNDPYEWVSGKRECCEEMDCEHCGKMFMFVRRCAIDTYACAKCLEQPNE